MSKEKISISDIQSPLYLHPSEGASSLGIEKLQGTSDYRSWRRSMEIALAAKRKLGFVTGVIKKDTTDEQKKEQWETCNHMVIAWIHSSVSDQIKKSILYAPTAEEAWKQLERTFNVANGSRKYKLEKEIMNTKQEGRSVYEYYTIMKGHWVEEDTLNL